MRTSGRTMNTASSESSSRARVATPTDAARPTTDHEPWASPEPVRGPQDQGHEHRRERLGQGQLVTHPEIGVHRHQEGGDEPHPAAADLPSGVACDHDAGGADDRAPDPGGKEGLESDERRDGQNEHEQWWPRRGLYLVMGATRVVDEGVDEPLPRNQQVGRVVVVVGIPTRSSLRSVGTEHRCQTDAQTHRRPEAEPGPPGTGGVPPPAYHGGSLYAVASGRSRIGERPSGAGRSAGSEWPPASDQ